MRSLRPPGGFFSDFSALYTYTFFAEHAAPLGMGYKGTRNHTSIGSQGTHADRCGRSPPAGRARHGSTPAPTGATPKSNQISKMMNPIWQSLKKGQASHHHHVNRRGALGTTSERPAAAPGQPSWRALPADSRHSPQPSYAWGPNANKVQGLQGRERALADLGPPHRPLARQRERRQH